MLMLRRQFLRESPTSAIEQHFYVDASLAQNLGDLRYAHVLGVMQPKHLKLYFRQMTASEPPQLQAILPPSHQFGRIVVINFFGRWLLPDLGFAAKVVNRGMTSQRKKPRRKFTARIISRDALESPYERVLCDFCGIVAVAAGLRDKAINAGS